MKINLIAFTLLTSALFVSVAQAEVDHTQDANWAKTVARITDLSADQHGRPLVEHISDAETGTESNLVWYWTP